MNNDDSPSHHPGIAIIRTPVLKEDMDALAEIFDFCTIESVPNSASMILIGNTFTIVLVPNDEEQPTGSTNVILVLTDESIKKARNENRGSDLLSWHGFSVGPNTIIMGKFTLKGGSTIVITTSDGLKDSSARARTLQFAFEKTDAHQDQIGSTVSKAGSSIDPPIVRSVSLPEFTQASQPCSDDNVNTKLRLFPSLQTQCSTKNEQLGLFLLNPRFAIPVETDLLTGKLLLVVKPTDPSKDPYWNEKIFTKKKRRLILQFQCKLKYTPQNPVYAGIEISEPMKLGLVKAGICNIILKFIQNFDSNLHYSFGDDKERPHMTCPAESFFDKFVVTPKGQEPPTLGGELEESAEFVKLRKQLKRRIEWNTENTYSMSYHTMYIDLPSWTTANIPLVKDMKLQTFWGNSFMNIVLYETNARQKQHLTNHIEYMFTVQLKYMEADEREYIEEHISDESSSGGDSFEIPVDGSSLSTYWEDLRSHTQSDVLVEVDTYEGNADVFFDAIQNEMNSLDSLPIIVPPQLIETTSNETVMRTIDEYCPYFIDIFSERRSYELVYVFKGHYPHTRPIFRPLSTALDFFIDCEPYVGDDLFSSRLSSAERSRRIIGIKYVKALGEIDVESRRRLSDFQSIVTSFDKTFLHGLPSHFKRLSSSLKNDLRGIYAVGRALSDRHWIEEIAILTDMEISFYRFDKRKPSLQIRLSSIINMGKPDNITLPGNYAFLSIESFGRTTYVMFNWEEDCTKWTSFLQEKAKNISLTSISSLTNHLVNVDDPMHEFLHKSTIFDCNKKKILNCRRFSFQNRQSTSRMDTLKLAEIALTKATTLQSKGPNDSDLIEFLDCAAALKNANIDDLNDDERLAFFINVYHILIMHAYIVLGPPKNGIEWLSYFNNIGYQCADDFFSLTELEHNIIRGKMSYPSQFLSRFVVPKSEFRFALRNADFRINFALNSGSLSMPTAAVPIYRANSVHEQLDLTVREFCRKTVLLSQGKRGEVFVTLPRICQWFASDFGDGSLNDIIKSIQPYLSKDKVELLRSLWNERKENFELKYIKYLPFLFECRFLTLMGECA